MSVFERLVKALHGLVFFLVCCFWRRSLGCAIQISHIRTRPLFNYLVGSCTIRAAALEMKRKPGQPVPAEYQNKPLIKDTFVHFTRAPWSFLPNTLSHYYTRSHTKHLCLFLYFWHAQRCQRNIVHFCWSHLQRSLSCASPHTCAHAHTVHTHAHTYTLMSDSNSHFSPISIFHSSPTAFLTSLHFGEKERGWARELWAFIFPSCSSGHSSSHHLSSHLFRFPVEYLIDYSPVSPLPYEARRGRSVTAVGSYVDVLRAVVSD